MKDGYKLASKCGLWTDIYKKIKETKILMIALVVQPSFRCPAVDRDVTLVEGVLKVLVAPLHFQWRSVVLHPM